MSKQSKQFPLIYHYEFEETAGLQGHSGHETRFQAYTLDFFLKKSK